jgi:hypothetical protein
VSSILMGCESMVVPLMNAEGGGKTLSV